MKITKVTKECVKVDRMNEKTAEGDWSKRKSKSIEMWLRVQMMILCEKGEGDGTKKTGSG
jgi:hypothetical protein